ncbi:iron-siderophore ABC transporter substrate-binding protein [Kineosporia sp. J2-2]|uniref:Iron-siderophore ABC transporter substrate-binding protein n=1 Tax=Kineosporia corallincola TaxID=2835133 RepID=A0ABS5THP0_9ACTN|nr:iron-siderophore ABC transporter substrate-binding protein [Kineosporia corallincola]MBT0769573.1 iron-siderophore ABC transporter substrate-binding protein [Kineosporia corallincola]
MSAGRSPSLTVAVLAATVLAVGACSSGSSGEGGDSGGEGSTRSVTDVQGTEVEVPVAPERVVALSEPTLDGVLALGVTPVGATSGRGQSTVPGYLSEKADRVPIVGAVGEPDLEAIGKADPDLILVDGTTISQDDSVLATLRKIAPTVVAGEAGGDWRTTFTNVAGALNRSDEGEQVVADYEDHVAQVNGELGDRLDDTYSIVRWQGSSASLILKELPAGVALTDLGMKRPDSQDREGEGHSEPVSQENIADIDADYIFFGTLGGSSVSNPSATGSTDADAAESALKEAEEVPGFTKLQAYQDDHIIAVDGSVWTSTGGPLLMNAIVDDVEASLT